MAEPSLLIRADAGPQQGAGHVMRMLALAEAWNEQGGTATLASRCPERLAVRARAMGVSVISFDVEPGTDADGARTAAEADRLGCGYLACDGYSFGERFQRVVGRGRTLLIVDDNGENGSYAANLVLNVNLHAQEGLYTRREPGTRLLLGTTYALIRRDIRAAAARRPQRTSPARRVLITMGGADPVDATGKLLSAVVDRGDALRDLEFRVLVGPANPRLAAYQAIVKTGGAPIELEFDAVDVTRAMVWADVAIVGAGGTVWELALLGVPSLTVALAENQRPLSERLAASGAVEHLGDARETVDPRAWLERVIALCSDERRRRALIERSIELVDGRGAYRVASALRGE